MAAALLRSSLGQALRRAAAAPAPSSRLSSAAGGANTTAERTYYGYTGRSRYDARAYSQVSEFFPPSESDKFDGLFGFAAFLAASLFVGLMDGEYHFWARPNMNAGTRPPRMSRPGR